MAATYHPAGRVPSVTAVPDGSPELEACLRVLQQHLAHGPRSSLVCDLRPARQEYTRKECASARHHASSVRPSDAI
eukprot:jgi/Tetstr1/424877/TSEL_015372.t1